MMFEAIDGKEIYFPNDNNGDCFEVESKQILVFLLTNTMRLTASAGGSCQFTSERDNWDSCCVRCRSCRPHHAWSNRYSTLQLVLIGLVFNRDHFCETSPIVLRRSSATLNALLISYNPYPISTSPLSRLITERTSAQIKTG